MAPKNSSKATEDTSTSSRPPAHPGPIDLTGDDDERPVVKPKPKPKPKRKSDEPAEGSVKKQKATSDQKKKGGAQKGKEKKAKDDEDFSAEDEDTDEEAGGAPQQQKPTNNGKNGKGDRSSAKKHLNLLQQTPSQQLAIQQFTEGKGGILEGLTIAETNTLMSARTVGVMNERLVVEGKKLEVTALCGQARCVEAKGKLLFMSTAVTGDKAAEVKNEMETMRAELDLIKTRLGSKLDSSTASPASRGPPTAGPSNSYSP